MFTSPSNSGCQQFSNFNSYAIGQLKISDSSMFMIGVDPSSYHLHLYKHTFSNTSPDWSLKLSWPSGTWTIGTYESDSLLISSSIYAFFAYGSTNYLYMAVISLSDGTVSNRHKSSVSCNSLRGSGNNGDYIAASVTWSSSYLLMFNIATNLFDIKLFSGTGLFGIGLDTTGR